MDVQMARRALLTIAAIELPADDPQHGRLATAIDQLASFIDRAAAQTAPRPVRQIGAAFLARNFIKPEEGAIDASGD